MAAQDERPVNRPPDCKRSSLSFSLIPPYHTPHFHAYYQEEVGIYGIERIERLAGSLPVRQERLVLAWAELHQEELRADWRGLQNGRPPVKIEPLK